MNLAVLAGTRCMFVRAEKGSLYAAGGVIQIRRNDGLGGTLRGALPADAVPVVQLDVPPVPHVPIGCNGASQAILDGLLSLRP